MRTTVVNARRLDGSTLAMVVVLGGIMSITIGSMLYVSGSSLRAAHGRADWNSAFYHAENALQWASQTIADATPASSSLTYSTADGTLTLAYMSTAKSDPTSGFRNARVTIQRTNASLPNNYLIKASARVGDKVRTLQAVVTKGPASEIFDYEYFLNNWGWWWGASITGNGGNRANWDFDFRDHPTVNGLILANGNVTQNSVPVDQLTNSPPFGGLAGTDPISWAHAGVPRVTMPNLRDFAYYTNKALANTTSNSLWIGTNQVVFGVYNNTTQPGLYLVGTDAAPIHINQTVVIPGDVVIKGKITGQGTLYVGGNLYVAGDLTYVNGPDWTTPPETMTTTQRDQWVANSQTKDLVGFAVRGSVLGGDVNSSDWKTWCYNPTEYGLKYLGDEAHLGQDGILNTPDDTIAFLHSDGTTSTACDADGDGVIRGNFDYATELQMTATRAAKIAGYPIDTDGNSLSYSSLASNTMGSLDAIFYTNHAFAMRLAKSSVVFHGVVVSRNEAIVYNSTCRFNYDSRVHSRYNNNPNKFVDLGLPIAGLLRMDAFAELAPDRTNL